MLTHYFGEVMFNILLLNWNFKFLFYQLSYFTVLLISSILFAGNLYALNDFDKATQKLEQSNSYTKDRPFRIATIKDYPPLSTLLPSGQPTGYYIDLWKLWSKTTGIPIEIIAMEYADHLSAIRSRKVDMLAGLFINQERKQWANFSIPIAKIRTATYFSSDRIDRPSLATMKDGEIVAVPRGTHQELYLKSNYPKLNVTSFDDSKKIIFDLIQGKVDVIVTETPHMRAQIGILGLQGMVEIGEKIIVTNTSHGLVLKENLNLLKLVNQGLRAIPIEQLLSLEKKWMQAESSYFESIVNPEVPSLTIEESDWLVRHPRLVLGVSPAVLPFESLDQKGDFSGISSDYIHLIEDKLQIEIIPQVGLAWAEVLELAKQRKIDVLSAVVSTSERESYLNFTNNYISVPLVIATHTDSPLINGLKDLAGLVVGVEGSTPPESILRDEHPGIKLKIFDSAKDGLVDLQNGKIDALVHNLATTTYVINREKMKNIQIAASTSHELKIAMGVRKGLEPLVNILRKTLLTVDDNTRRGITNKWISIQLDFSTQLKTLLIWLLPIGSLMFAVTLIVVRTNRSLQSEVEGRKRKEKSLEEIKQQAEKASSVKDLFLANMSHELRTPMNAIIGMSQLFEQTKIDHSQRKQINTISSSANTLLKLINDILDLSKIQAGKMELESLPFNLSSLIDNVKRQAEFASVSENGKLCSNEVKQVIDIQKNIPEKLVGDSLRLTQVLAHIIDNAKKFTHKGKIQLNISSKTIDETCTELHFEIKDTGIGMSDQQVSGLFDAYNQVDTSITREYEGVGIGLSLCKKLCELMGGELWVSSQIDIGSEFHVTARLKVDKSIAGESEEGFNKKKVGDALIEGDQQEQTLAGKKILVVDDNVTNRLVARKMLQRFKIEVLEAKNGVECLLLLTENTFDAVLMDIQMPVMDGLTCTSKIRENKAYDSLPVIGLSANTAASDIEIALDVGMDQYLAKPINSKKLAETLMKQIFKPDK